MNAHSFRQILIDTVHHLEAKSVTKDALAELVERRFLFLWKRKPRFSLIAHGWPLGVFVLADTGELFAAGETTRAVPPKHAGHVSQERERRRFFNEVAFNGPFSEGEVVHFGLHLIDFSSPSPASPLILVAGTPLVRWNPGVSIPQARPFEDYLAEQVDLLITRHSQ